MAQLKTKIKLYLEANSKTWDGTKVSLQDNSDGNGAFISSWSYDRLAQPTAEQIASMKQLVMLLKQMLLYMQLDELNTCLGNSKWK